MVKLLAILMLATGGVLALAGASAATEAIVCDFKAFGSTISHRGWVSRIKMDPVTQITSFDFRGVEPSTGRNLWGYGHISPNTPGFFINYTLGGLFGTPGLQAWR